MGFEDLTPQPARTAANTRHPEPAIAYGARSLALSREAAARCRTVLDVAYGPADDQRLDVYLPADDVTTGVPVVLYFHGGAWAFGYKEWNGFIAPALIDLPAIFVSAGYRLAPEHKFPAPLEDAFAALRWVRDNAADLGGDPDRIFVAGWSVGGTLASLLALRRELYAGYGLPDDVIKACFASSAGFAYPSEAPAPGNSGMTYGDLIYAKPEDDVLATALNHARGNRIPFHISHAAEDFAHVMNSSAAMAALLKEQHGVVAYDVFEAMDHYDCNLATAEPGNRWNQTLRAWMTALPVVE